MKEGGINMPELRCTVQTCVHNQQYLCDLDKIEVAGRDGRLAVTVSVRGRKTAIAMLPTGRRQKRRESIARRRIASTTRIVTAMPGASAWKAAMPAIAKTRNVRRLVTRVKHLGRVCQGQTLPWLSEIKKRWRVKWKIKKKKRREREAGIT